MSDSFRTVSSDLEMMINRQVESHRRITELEAELYAIRESARWVPVGERLPMDLLNRNVQDAQGHVGTARQRLPYAAGIWDKTGSETLGVITHWKDLPIGVDTGACYLCAGTGWTDLHYCDGELQHPRRCPCECPMPAPPEPQAVQDVPNA